MFYHALIGNGGTTPTEDLEPVLLWTNSNPTVGFAAQTVSLDLSDYAGVIIEFHQSNSQSYGTRAYIKKNDNVNGINGVGYPNASVNTGLARSVTVTDSGIVFGAGMPNSDNIDCVPNRIYGVKKYVVEPVMGDLLWTNSSPTTEMAAIDIDGEYSKYSKIYVEATISTSNNAKLTAIIEKNAAIGGGIAGSITISGNYYHVFRIIEFNDKIKILACKKTSGSTISTDNSLCIITKIYGIE